MGRSGQSFLSIFCARWGNFWENQENIHPWVGQDLGLSFLHYHLSPNLLKVFPQKRSPRPSIVAEGHQQPSTKTKMMALKGPFILGTQKKVWHIYIYSFHIKTKEAYNRRTFKTFQFYSHYIITITTITINKEQVCSNEVTSIIR